MASIQVTNQKTANALRGQSVIIGLDDSDVDNIPDLSVGDLCEVDSSSKIGYISEIDTYGVWFKVRPQYPSGTFDSTAGYLEDSETITITT